MRIDAGKFAAHIFSVAKKISRDADNPLPAHSVLAKADSDQALYQPVNGEIITSDMDNMDAELAVLEKLHAKTHALKRGIIQELLTGKTILI